MENLVRLTALQILIPAVSTGLLFAGTLLFLYIFILYHQKVYLSVFLLGLLGFVFVGSETLILFIGGQYRNILLGREFQRIEQVAATFFMFAIPFLVSEYLQLTPALKKINKYIMYAGLTIATLISIIAYVSPELFISFTTHHPKWLVNEADYPRGGVGFVYNIRDIILGLLIIYFLAMLLIDIFMHKRLKVLLFPLIGILVGIYSAVVDILFIYTGVNYDLFPNEIFSRFSFGITFFILTAMINMSRKFIESAKELEETYKKLKISERKYRILVEGTQDWIFTMDRNFIITSANKTFLKENGLKEDALGKMHFLELIYIPVEGSQLLLQVIKSEIEKLINEKKPITLRTFFYDRNMDAPKEYVLRMENISIDNQFEILCKASKSQDDQLIEYFHSEKNKYVLPNNILVAKEMSKRVVKNLTKYMDPSEVQLIEMAVFEMIINAIEHGNLEIGFEEKTQALQNGDYLTYIIEKQKQPQYKDKKVTIEYSITPEQLAVKVSDEGKGFDYKRITQKTQEANENMLGHGRGIGLILRLFDEVKYNSIGNQVLLIKKLQNNVS